MCASVRYDLWPRPYRLRSFAGRVMRVAEDYRWCVAFIGHSEGPPGYGFSALGTGFFVGYEGRRYFVSNQHVAVRLGDAPFAIRLNKIGGGSDNCILDLLGSGVDWVCN